MRLTLELNKIRKGNAMEKFLVFLVLSAMFFAQPCTSRPVLGGVQFSNRRELYTHVLEEYKALIEGTLNASKYYLEPSQAEIAAMVDPSETLRLLNAKILVLLGDIDVVLIIPEASGGDASTNFLQMLICFAKTLIFPNEFLQQLEALELLERNGLSRFYDDFQNDASNFLDKFDEAIRVYLDNLSEVRKMEEREMFQWYGEFRNVSWDTRSRFQKASEFFQRFEPADLRPYKYVGI